MLIEALLSAWEGIERICIHSSQNRATFGSRAWGCARPIQQNIPALLPMVAVKWVRKCPREAQVRCHPGQGVTVFVEGFYRWLLSR